MALCIVLTMSTLSGCGTKTPVKDGAAVKEEQSIVYNLVAEPDSIDPGLETTVGGSTVANQVFEGLMRLDNDNKPYLPLLKKLILMLKLQQNMCFI